MQKRRSSGQTQYTVLVLCFGMHGALGCTSVQVTPEERSGDRALGRLELPLVTPAEGQFRLRSARFDISDTSGTSVASLDSDTAPSAEAFTLDLPQARYSIRLQDGWSLEALFDDGGASPVHAALLTLNPQDFEILNGEVTLLQYAFTTNAGTVTFGEGSLSISIDVTTANNLPACDLINPTNTCPTGQSCLLADDNGTTFCAAAGPLPVGSYCEAEQCVVGAQCLKLDAASSDTGSCTAYCNPDYPPAGCDCVSLSFSSGVGVCAVSDCAITSGCSLDCDPATEVEFSGRCYYLDGSGGACDSGYVLAPQQVLASIGSAFIGKDYKHAISDNCCVQHSAQDVEQQDYGMASDCNYPGPFSEGPLPGGAGCLDILNQGPRQLTLCMTAGGPAHPQDAGSGAPYSDAWAPSNGLDSGADAEGVTP